jgi:hypothetical protein
MVSSCVGLATELAKRFLERASEATCAPGSWPFKRDGDEVALNDRAPLSDETLEEVTASVLRARAAGIALDPEEVRARIRAAADPSPRRTSARRLVQLVTVVALVLVGTIVLTSSARVAGPEPSVSPAPVPTWTTLTWSMTAAAAFAGSVGQNTQLGDAIHWRGGYVLVGEVSPTTGLSSSTTGLIWASPDGTTWERVANGAGLFDAAEIDAVRALGPGREPTDRDEHRLRRDRRPALPVCREHDRCCGRVVVR